MLVTLVIVIFAKLFNSLVTGLFIGSINTTELVTLFACKPVATCHIFTQRTQCPSCTMGLVPFEHLSNDVVGLIGLLI